LRCRRSISKKRWADLTSEEKLDHLKEENGRIFSYVSALSETVKDLRRRLESAPEDLPASEGGN
jgi:hypothetical protein